MTYTMGSKNEPMITPSGFSIFVHPAEEGETGYWAEVLNLPGCLSQGETLEELYANIQEAITAILPHSVTNTDAPPHNISLWPPETTRTA